MRRLFNILKHNRKSKIPETMDLAISTDLDNNIKFLKKQFENSSDVVFRQITTAKNKAYIIFVDGLIDSARIELHAIQQLLEQTPADALDTTYIEEQIISVNSVTEENKFKKLLKQILDGNTILLVDKFDKALVLGAKGGSSRSISEPDTESVIRGPREGFTESLRVNTSLVRRKIHSNHLKVVSRTVGTETQTSLAILYLENLAPPQLVEEVLARIDRIKIDGILESGYIEELIEDDTWSPFPQIQNTERPDTVAANLLEGRVSIIVDGTPFVLILPTSFWQFIQASEDYYQRFHISVFLRLLRVTLLFLALLMPALYVAIASFHQEMIPTTLLLSIAASREAIPFPVFIEALIMELSFEALREAGIRLPKVIGQAVSILGALVIGTAAVEAGIVSAPMVIIVSLTGIASFTIPRFNLAISIRLLRFPMMILAGIFGLFGVVLGSIVLLTHLCKLRSFGVPYFSPLSPLKWSDLKDVFIRVPWWDMDRRPKQFVKEDPVREGSNLKASPNQKES
ncbi:spore germination protein [Salinibacillus xinjiangensis]|uniref:Spore germination protein n=1 Tax=Salinibacillus xinjiangensis TaxID=1229268 RepID=A0A6G1X9J0_9BACI|nr:spore germination protein [Salinibacillus xinjiangensis]MRG87612.1 spore germination protein [Salinibacillus xinjiangensis]